MSESKFLYPYTERLGDSDADKAEQELLINAVLNTKIYAGPNPYDGISTDVLLELDDWR